MYGATQIYHVRTQRRLWQQRQFVLVLRQSQCDEPLDGLIQAGGIEGSRVVDERKSPFAAIPGTHRHGRKERYQRSLQRSGQHDRAPIAPAPQTPAQLPARTHGGFAMGHIEFDRPVNFRHSIQYGLRPRRRDHVYPQAAVAAQQQLVERLGHDHVADPRRTHDEQFIPAHRWSTKSLRGCPDRP